MVKEVGSATQHKTQKIKHGNTFGCENLNFINTLTAIRRFPYISVVLVVTLLQSLYDQGVLESGILDGLIHLCQLLVGEGSLQDEGLQLVGGGRSGGE